MAVMPPVPWKGKMSLVKSRKLADAELVLGELAKRALSASAPQAAWVHSGVTTDICGSRR